MLCFIYYGKLDGIGRDHSHDLLNEITVQGRVYATDSGDQNSREIFWQGNKFRIKHYEQWNIALTRTHTKHMTLSHRGGVTLANITEFPVYRVGPPNPLLYHLPLHAPPARLDLSGFCQYSTCESLYCQELAGEATAVVFEVVGKLREEEFYLTTDGRPVEGGREDRGREACCWVESPSEEAKLGSQWNQMMRALHVITLRHTLQDPKRLQTPNSLLRTESDKIYLKIGWSIRDKETGVRTSVGHRHVLC